MNPKILTNGPHEVLGYRKNGTPIFPIAGGSEPAAVEPPPGNTITVAPLPPEPPPTPTAVPVVPGANGSQVFTAADIEAARQQEKDKLYQRIEGMDTQLKTFQKDRDERLAAEEKARMEAEAEADAERKKNLTFEDKLLEMQQANDARHNELQGEIAKRDKLLEMERNFQALGEYRTRRLSEESENIMPELHSWVAGNSEEEIEANISRAVETTSTILNQVTQAQQAQQVAQQQVRQQARGTGVTAPPVGPLENQSGQETFTAEDISNMSMSDYAKNRGRLLEAASSQMRGR